MGNAANILVVDDELGVCDSCAKILTRKNHSVDYTLVAQEALKKLEQKKYDLVITDLKMPGISGMDLLATVKRRWKDLGVIMITGYGTIQSAVQAIKIGAFDYIAKPFTPEELDAVVERALESARIKSEEMKRTGGEEEPSVSTLNPDVLENMWCIPEQSWVKIEDDTARMGVDAMYRRAMTGEIESIELPSVGDFVEQGKFCARITVKLSDRVSGLTSAVHNIWSPVSGEVVEINSGIKSNPKLLGKSPYGSGWLIRVKPSKLDEELKALKSFSESIEGNVAKKIIRRYL